MNRIMDLNRLKPAVSPRRTRIRNRSNALIYFHECGI
jgi:hypothetical protein